MNPDQEVSVKLAAAATTALVALVVQKPGGISDQFYKNLGTQIASLYAEVLKGVRGTHATSEAA